MTDLQTTILQKASGESRLNPDEQRRYLGTFRERVVLVLDFDQINQASLSEHFASICQDLSKQYQPLFLKLSPSLSDQLQISLMKIAQQHTISCSIIDEKVANCTYAAVFHTDHAVDKEEIALETVFPQFHQTTEKKEEKTSFWKRLFG